MHPRIDKSSSRRSWLLATLCLSAILCLIGFIIFGYWALSAIQSAISHAIVPASLEQLEMRMAVPQKAAVVTKAVGLASPTTGAPPLAALTQFVTWESIFQLVANDPNVEP